MSKHTVLVTGASSGIGMELARQFAQLGHNLVMLARGRAALEALALEIQMQHKVSAQVIVADLCDPQAPANILEELTRRDLQIDVLVNNAGFGLLGPHADLDVQRQMDMVQVNITSLVLLTRLLLPGMLARDTGGVLNVASTAAFQAGPNMAIYYASKAFVLSYTEALHEEVGGTKLHVSCLCPGPTHTGFVAAAGMEGVGLFKLGAQSAEEVARVGVTGFQNNRTIAISGFKNSALAFLGKFSPRFVTRKIAQALNR
ncbi:SDR family oxidoreductase [Rhodoferax sp.]|uniref:SDR family NAD(P)-dependent oxidoreductase n=1 Tax=Rhodoferax sp. TaxID=50421 RepID=UPI0025DEF406|nr:SDR family oxidoreductase [Rhodoferax sp.]